MTLKIACHWLHRLKQTLTVAKHELAATWNYCEFEWNTIGHLDLCATERANVGAFQTVTGSACMQHGPNVGRATTWGMPSLRWAWQHRRGPQQRNKESSVLPQGLAIAHHEHGTQLHWIDSRGAQEACQFPVSGATGILKSRHCWRLADVAMREMQCQFFLSVWYYSHPLVG